MRSTFLLTGTAFSICQCADIGHEPIERQFIDASDWTDISWIDLTLCGSEATRPIYGVEFWASRDTQLRLFVVGRRDQESKWPFLAYTNSIQIKGAGVFHIWFREPKLLQSNLCFGWTSNVPTIPHDEGPRSAEVHIGHFGGLPSLGSELCCFQELPSRNYSISLHTSPPSHHVGGANRQASVSIVERRLIKQQPKAHGTAVCIAGDLRMLNITARSIMDLLVKPLAGDLFIYGPKPRMEDQMALGWLLQESSTKALKLLAENLTASMRSLPNDQKRALARAMCEMPGNWLGGAPRISKCDMDDLPEFVGWVPPQGQIEGSNIFQMWARRQCAAMVSEYETHMRGGRHYETLVYSRSDLKWLLPHPTIHQLEAYKSTVPGWDTIGLANPNSPHRAWIPQSLGDDWGGLYDRHIVLPRWLVESCGIMNDWDLLLNGVALEWLISGLNWIGEARFGGDRTEHGVNTELWLSVRLWFGGANVARFPAMAYVACDQKDWKRHFDSKPTNVKHRWSKGFPCQEEGFRFPQEYRAATTFAACMEHDTVHDIANGRNLTSSDYASLWDDHNLTLRCESEVIEQAETRLD